MAQPAAKRPCLVEEVRAIVNYDEVITVQTNGFEQTFTVCGTCSYQLKGAQPTQHSKSVHESSKRHLLSLRVPRNNLRQTSMLGLFPLATPPGAGSAPAGAAEHPVAAIEPIAEASLDGQAVAAGGVTSPGPANPMVVEISSGDEADGSDDGMAQGARGVSPLAQSRVSKPCEGYDANLPAEPNAFYRYFPFQLMGDSRLFNLIRLEGCKLYSVNCHGVGEPSCIACSRLAGNRIIRGIESRALEAQPRTNHLWLGFQGMEDALVKQSDETNRFRLLVLNAGRHASFIGKSIGVYKRFVLTLSEKDVPRLRVIMGQNVKQGGSMRCVLPLVCCGKLNGDIMDLIEAGYLRSDI